MAQLLNNMNTPILQVPLGFIRVIEFPLTILAFAATSRYSASGNIMVDCTDKLKKSYPIEFSYPFKMSDTEIPISLQCDNKQETVTLFAQGFGGSSQFFVFVGVISMLYIIGSLMVYLFMWQNYENDARFANVDFLVTTLLGFFWFIASCAWSSGVNGLKTITSDGAIQDVMKGTICSTKQCKLESPWDYASLNVSLIAGFTCMALFVSNLWFIYKETAWFKARSAETSQQPGMPAASGQPAGPAGQPVYR